MKNNNEFLSFITSIYKIIIKIFIIVSMGLGLGFIFYFPLKWLNLPALGKIVFGIVILIYGISVVEKDTDEENH